MCDSCLNSGYAAKYDPRHLCLRLAFACIQSGACGCVGCCSEAILRVADGMCCTEPDLLACDTCSEVLHPRSSTCLTAETHCCSFNWVSTSPWRWTANIVGKGVDCLCAALSGEKSKRQITILYSWSDAEGRTSIQWNSVVIAGYLCQIQQHTV